MGSLIIQIVVVLIVVGALLGLLNTYGPAINIDGTIIRIINAVAIIGVVVWLLIILLNLSGVGTGGMPSLCS